MTYLNDEKFCEEYGVSRVYTWSQRKEGLLPYSIIAGRIVYSVDDIAEWESNCKLAATERSRGPNTIWRRVKGKRRRLGGRIAA
ncbi:MAG: hypothetical protein H0U18_01155 [Pyrinomonadaceae bacterium]|jgi:hypothetical protein|nr:hypothetical protein [Pyrinomonadaceae bacterium]